MSGCVLLQFYNNPPNCPLLPGHEEDCGSHDTAPLTSVDDALSTHYCMNQDEYLCFKLMQFALHYLSQIGNQLPHNLMDNISITTNRAFAAMHPGDEVRNIDIFTHIFNYVREFVTAADWCDVTSVQAVPFSDQKDASWALNRTIKHHGINQILVENVSLATFEKYKEGIWDLAYVEAASVELSFEAPEEGPRAIIFRVSAFFFM